MWTRFSGVDLSLILGGKNLGHKFFGPKRTNFGKIYSSILKNFWWLFLVIDYFFSEFSPFSSLLPYSFFVFFFVSPVVHVLKKSDKIKKFSSDYWGAKRGLSPILIIGGMCPGCPPESTPMTRFICEPGFPYPSLGCRDLLSAVDHSPICNESQTPGEKVTEPKGKVVYLSRQYHNQGW